MGTGQKDSVNLFAQADFAHVLVVFLFNLQNLSQLPHLLLQPLDLLAHCVLLAEREDPRVLFT